MISISAFLLTIFALPGGEAEKYVVPKQVIVGAESPVPLGELVDLSLSAIEPKPANLIQQSVAWQVFEGGVPKRVRSTGEGVFFGAGVQPKKMLVVAAVSYLFASKEGDRINDVQVKIVLLTADLQIGRPEPLPGPGPRPVPPPDSTPTLPEGRFGLAKISFDLAMSKVAENRASGASILGSSFESLASAVAAGAYKTVESILKATNEANNSALTQANLKITDWDAFGNDLQKLLYDLHKNKKLVTTEDYSDAWKEIALGLRAIK